MIYVGQDWTKQPGRFDRISRKGKHPRLAQISALDKDYAYMYWPDNGCQTRVRRERLNWTTEWVPA